MALALLLNLTSCEQVPVRDETIYALKGIAKCPVPTTGGGALLAHTLTAQELDLSEAQWEATVWGIMATKKAVVCMSTDALGDFKSDIEKLCSEGNYCSYQTQTQVQALSMKLRRLELSVRR